MILMFVKNSNSVVKHAHQNQLLSLTVSFPNGSEGIAKLLCASVILSLKEK